MYFLLPAALLFLVYVGQELNLRHESGRKLGTWSELWHFLLKKKKSKVFSELSIPHKIYPFFYAFTCGVVFAFWESVLWFLLERPGHLGIGIAGLGLFALLILRRRQLQAPLSAEPRPMYELAAIWVALLMCFQPLFTAFIFSPWVFYRAFTLRSPAK